MDHAVLSAFAEHIKLSFGPAEAARVLQVAKKKQISPKVLPAIMGPAMMLMPRVPMFGVAGKQRLAASIKQKARAAELAIANDPNLRAHGDAIRAAVSAQHKAEMDTVRKVAPHGAIIQGGPATTAIESAVRKGGAPIPARPPSDQRQMLEAVVKGHELDETLVRPALSFKPFGHNSPDVLLREHNRLATLPTANSAVRDYMRDLRKNTESPVLAQYGIDFGKSERLSRHARKRITEHMERRTMKELGA